MRPRITLSVGNFFFSICSSVISIILFPYLAQFMPEAYAGFVVSGSSLLAIMIFPFVPRIIERHGAVQIALITSLVELIVLLALAAVPGTIAAIVLMGMSIILQPLLAYELDLLLDATIDGEKSVGRIRALFRTAWSAGSLAAPLLIGALLVHSNSYGFVFMAAAMALIPIIMLFATRDLPKGPAPKVFSIHDTLIHIVRHRDLAAVMVGNLLLYLFYVWAPLYTPFYLNSVIGIPWSTLGWMFFVMLLPYVLVEYPAGWLADKYLGDKKLMITGFIIAGGALASFGLLTPETSIAVILCALVISRVGSALVESMVSAHFFRRVSSTDLSSVEIFGSAWPLSYAIAPVIGSSILLATSYPTFFFITGGFIACVGMITASLIKDFR